MTYSLGAIARSINGGPAKAMKGQYAYGAPMSFGSPMPTPRKLAKRAMRAILGNCQVLFDSYKLKVILVDAPVFENLAGYFGLSVLHDTSVIQAGAPNIQGEDTSAPPGAEGVQADTEAQEGHVRRIIDYIESRINPRPSQAGEDDEQIAEAYGRFAGVQGGG